jgi:hypothetical protein
VSSSAPEFVTLAVHPGALVADGNWVYAWLDDAGRVVYVGATSLDPRTRVWLHLNDADPDVGRIRAHFPRVSEAALDVIAMRVPDEVVRADVRDALGARLAEEGLLAHDAVTHHLQLSLEPTEETLGLVERFVARLRSQLEPSDPALL